MNQLSYHVDNKKILSNRIKIVGNIENDIKSTMKILRNLIDENFKFKKNK